MKIEVRIPEVGESVKEALLTQWYRRDGDLVRKGEILFLIETDKVTLEVVAEGDGILKIGVPEGATVPVGAVVATLESDGTKEAGMAKPVPDAAPEGAQVTRPEMPAGLRLAVDLPLAERGIEVGPPAAPIEPRAGGGSITPSARTLAEEQGVDLAQIQATGPGGRVTRGDVLLFLEQTSIPGREEASAGVAVRPLPPSPVTETPPPAPAALPTPAEATTRKPMSPIRQRIAERLLAARQSTAMLTTFNEVDMTRVQALGA